MDLSIIIPAYNEEERIAPTLLAIDEYLAGRGLSFEIVVVDDGSTDGTVVLVESLVSTMINLRCLESPQNRGR